MLIPTCLIKFMELLLTIACLTLHHYSYDLTDVSTLILCSGTYVGYVVVLSGEIIGEMMLAPLDLVQDMYFGILGMGLFSVCGGMVLNARLHKAPYPRTGDHMTAVIAGSLAVFNAVLMFLDFSMAYLDSEEFDDDTSEAVSAAADAYVDALWSGAGGALFGACGGLTLNWWKTVPDCPRKVQARAAAICSIANAALLAIDALLSYCSAQKDDNSSRSRSNKGCSS